MKNFQNDGLGAEDRLNGLWYNPVWLFPLGWAKEEVYKPSNLQELDFEIRDVLMNIPPEFLQKAVMEEVPSRLRKLRERNGGYVEISV